MLFRSNATMAGFFAAYHGREGLQRIARHAHSAAVILATEIQKYGYALQHDKFFDTLRFTLPEGVNQEDIRDNALSKEINLFYCPCGCTSVGLSTDETINEEEIYKIIAIFAEAAGKTAQPVAFTDVEGGLDSSMLRTDEYLKQQVFNIYRSESAMMRYMKNLERRDITLATSMISLGSCTMKLNAAVRSEERRVGKECRL